MSEGTAFAEVNGLVLALLDGLVSLAERALRPAPPDARRGPAPRAVAAAMTADPVSVRQFEELRVWAARR